MACNDDAGLEEPFALRKLDIESGLLGILRTVNDINLTLYKAIPNLPIYSPLNYRLRSAWFQCHFLLSQDDIPGSNKGVKKTLEGVAKYYVRIFEPI
jgi:hypothetical protein